MNLDRDKYEQANGYLPRPLLVSEFQTKIKRTDLTLIEKLAEDLHNVWAADRIKEGWTYGMSDNRDRKLNPSLVPYLLLDEQIKESNRYSQVIRNNQSIQVLGTLS